MNNYAPKRILATLLAVLLIITASPAFAAETSHPTTNSTGDPIGLSQAEKVLPDLSNLEAPPPSPARTSTRKSLELVSRDTMLIEPTRDAKPGLMRGTPTQDNWALSGQLAKAVSINGNLVFKSLISNKTRVTFLDSFLASVIDTDITAGASLALGSDNVAATVKQAISSLESEAYSTIGNVTWNSDWYTSQIKMIFTELNANANNGILLGYFDPGDFPGGSSLNSDYYLYIDVSNFPGGGFDRYQNQNKQFIGTILHEYAHMVNFSVGYDRNSGMANAQMQTWLDEAIATTYAYNYSNTFEQPYLVDFLEQDFKPGVGYVPYDSQWDGSNANYGAAALMMLDLTQYDLPHLAEPPMEHIIQFQRNSNTYATSLNAVGSAYSYSFNDYFTQFNLDVAVDNDPVDHAAAMANLGSGFYGLDAIDYIWQERYDSGRYAGVTSLPTNTSVDVSSEFENRSYYSHIYLADTVGADCSRVKINVPSGNQTEYYLISPYNQTDVDTDLEWQNCAKQAAKLTAGDNTVTVGTNNQFAVLAIQYGSAMSAGQMLSFQPLSSGKAITSFNLNGVNGAISGNTITVALPFGSDVTNAVPTITHTGLSISPAPNTAQDFTNPVVYTVTAEDNSQSTYTATVNVAQSSSKSITFFALLGAQGSINEATKTITVTLPTGTDVTNAAPAITHTGANISPASGAVRDFTGPVSYTVTARDASTENYTVTVNFVDGPYVDETSIAITVGETKTLHVSLGQSGNAADNANINSNNTGVVAVSSPSLGASGNIGITGVSEGSTNVVVTFSGGTAAPTYFRIPVVVTALPATAHTITVTNDGHGTASADKITATVGETVMLTAFPSSGYHLKEWQVISGAITISGNSFGMPDEPVTIQAVFESTAVPSTDYTISFDPNGGTRIGGGALTQTVAAGGDAVAPTVTRSGYTFTDWDTAFTNVQSNLIVTAGWSYNGGTTFSKPTDRGSSSRDNSRSTTPSKPVSTTYTVDAPKAKAALAAMKSGDTKAKISHSGSIKVLSEAWKLFAKTLVDFNTIEDKAVQVRITVKTPELVTKDMMVSGYVKGDNVTKLQNFFAKWYTNKVRIIHLEQSGTWGQPVEIAAKVDLTSMDTRNLVLYSYDKASNTYKHIENANIWIDKNGYLHFTTVLAGDTVVSSGALTRK